MYAQGIQACALSADGATVIAATINHGWIVDSGLKVWDLETGAKRLILVGHQWYIHGCAISADGSLIVTASHDHTLRVWDANGGDPLAVLGVYEPLYDCACSADGQHIVAVGKRWIYFLRLVR